MLPATPLALLPVTLALAASAGVPDPAAPASSAPSAPSASPAESAASPSAPRGPRLDAAGATPRWDHPLSLRLGLHAPAGDDTPLPRHCLTPTLHYGTWPVPAGQLRWRIEHDPVQRRAWLALESPLRVNEPWIDLSVEWHCGATEDRQALTLLVEPDWPGDGAGVALPPGPGDRGSASDHPPTPVRLSRVTAADLAPPPSTRIDADDWAALIERLARLEAGLVRRSAAASGATGNPGAPSAPGSPGLRQTAPPHRPGAAAAMAVATAPLRPATPGSAGPLAASPGSGVTVPSGITSADGPIQAAASASPAAGTVMARASAADGPARIVSVAPSPPAWASPWPWMLASGVLGWAWGRRPRTVVASGFGARSAPAPASSRPPALPSRAVTARLPDAIAGATAAPGRWPAWFGAPTRPDAGPWLAGGLARPEPSRPDRPAAPTPSLAPDGPAQAPVPWSHGLVLTEVELDETLGPFAPKRTAAEAAVAGGGPA